MTSPISASAESLKHGLEHYADHCATCHANNGSGDTTIGRSVYPPAPDMRLASTQSLSDGELFYIIENGVRFTAMPAWSTGTPEGAEASWQLVQFIRHLPKLTPDELVQMEALNPKSKEDLEEELADQRFLDEPGAESDTGQENPPADQAAKPHH